MMTIALLFTLATSHPVATECAKSDYQCIVSHDDAVVTAAIVSTNRLLCPQFSTRPAACLALYDLAYSLQRTP